MATQGLFATLARSDDQDWNRAIQLSGMNPDQAATFARVRGAQAIGNGLSGPSDTDRVERARDRIRIEIMKLPQEQMADPTVTYPIMIRIMQEEGMVEEALKLAAEFKTMQRQDREQTRKEQKDAATAEFQRAKAGALKAGTPAEKMAAYADILNKLNDPTTSTEERNALLNMKRVAEGMLGAKMDDGAKVVSASKFGNAGIVKRNEQGDWEFQAVDAMQRATPVGGTGGGKGKAPAGYRWNEDGTELEPIPGGPAAVKADAAAAKSAAGNATAIEAGNGAIAAIDRLLAHPGFADATGLVGRGARLVPGTPAYDFDKELDSFKGRVFLSAIQGMRGMGALSDAEGKKLEASSGALDVGMSASALRSSLLQIRSDLSAKVNSLGGSVGSAPAAAPKSQTTAPKATKRFNPATGKLEAV